ncbi:MAG: hypothetical protein ACOCOK_04305, partial [Prevotella sp.]
GTALIYQIETCPLEIKLLVSSCFRLALLLLLMSLFLSWLQDDNEVLPNIVIHQGEMQKLAKRLLPPNSV